MKKNDLSDLDLENKMAEAKQKEFDKELVELQKKHGIALKAENIVDGQGIVRPMVLKVPFQHNDSIDKA